MRGRQKVILGILLVFVSGIFATVFFSTSDHGKLKVAFLDIGQGDAIFIETPNKTQVLIDGGPNGIVLRELAKQMSFFDRSIDMVIPSHPHTDHIGGLPEVFKRFTVAHLLVSGIDSDNSAYVALLNLAREQHTDIRTAQKGRVVLDQEHGIFLDILFPDREASGLEANTASIVAKLTYGKTSFLFTGDSPQNIEKYLVSVEGKDLDVDVLKLGHHGSKTSSSEEFLKETSPAYAVISAGKNNKYGLPNKEVLDLLVKDHIPYVDTMDDGTIIFESDGKSLVKK